MKPLLFRGLQWPDDRARVCERFRARYSVGDRQSIGDLQTLLVRMDLKNAVLTSNAEINNRGRPVYDECWRLKETGEDTAAALYCTRDGAPLVISCDEWTRLGHNIRAIWVTLESLLRIERSGASQMANQAYQAFAALGSSACVKEPWNAVLGIDPDATEQEIKKAYRAKALQNHPDAGGTSERMAVTIEAYKEGLSQLRRTA